MPRSAFAVWGETKRYPPLRHPMCLLTLLECDGIGVCWKKERLPCGNLEISADGVGAAPDRLILKEPW